MKYFYFIRSLFFAFLFIFYSISWVYGQEKKEPTEINKSEKPTEKLKEVVVFGNLDEARNRIVPSLGGTEYKIHSLQIHRQSQGENAPFNQVLLRAPGVAEDSFGQIHVRGEHSGLQYRINGVLLPQGVNGFGQELNTRFIDSVSLITGTLPAQYGLQTAGVIDIHTKSGVFNPGGIASIYGGSFNTVQPSFEYGGSSDRLNYYLMGTYLQNNLGIENPTSSYGAIHDNTRQYRGFGYISYLFDETSRINFLLSGTLNQFQIPNTPNIPPAYVLDGAPPFNSSELNERQNEQNNYLIVAYQKSAGKLNYQLSGFTRYSDVNYKPDQNGDLIFNGVATYIDRNSFGNGFEFDSSYKINDFHTLRGGTLFTINRTSANSTTWVFPADADGNQTSTAPFPITDNIPKTGYIYSAYIQDEWNPIKPLTVNYGVRFDGWNAFNNEYQFSPRLNVVYKPTEDTMFHAGYARYFTPPRLQLIDNEDVNAFDNTTNAAQIDQNSQVKLERTHYFDIGATHEFLKGLHVGLDGYLKLAKNQLDEGQFGQSFIFVPFNYNSGRIYGVEFSSTYKRGGLSIYGNLAYSKALGKQIISSQFLFEQDEIDFINSNYVHLDHDQRYTASLGGSYSFKDTMVYADMIIGSGLRRGFANTEKMPAYYPVNIGAEHTFKPDSGEITGVKIRLDIVNLFDQIYQLRDGSGIGVSASQFGERRGFFGTLSFLFGPRVRQNPTYSH